MISLRVMFDGWILVVLMIFSRKFEIYEPVKDVIFPAEHEVTSRVYIVHHNHLISKFRFLTWVNLT